MNTSHMSALQIKALNAWVEGLKNMGCQFGIIDLDGRQYGELFTPKVQPKKRVNSFKHVVTPFLDNLKVGEVGTLSYADMDANVVDSLQANVSGRAGAKWGNGSVITERDTVNKVINVMRVY